MRLPSLRQSLFLFACVAGCNVATGHDLMASVCTVRVRPDKLELQIKIAADSIWPLVQETIAPGAIFVLEDFEREGKPLLVAFARTMEELTVDGVALTPRETDVTVVEDNFVFTMVYRRPLGGVARLKENYLLRMPSGYLSRVRFLDQHDEVLSVKTLRGSDILFEMKLPLHPPKVPAAPLTASSVAR